MKAEHIGAGIATVGATLALYFLIAGEVSGSEAVAAAIVLAIVGPYAFAVSRTATVPMRLPWRGVWALLCAFGAVLPELWRVGRSLWRAVIQPPAGMAGTIKRVPFRYGTAAPGETGRRAAVGVSLSVAPNGVVIGMDQERNELTLHQLVGHPVRGPDAWPS